MSENVINALARNHERIKQEVTSIMGGKILEYEAKTIWRDGQSKGRISTYLNMRRNGIPQKSAQAMAELTDQQAQEAEHQLKETSSN